MTNIFNEMNTNNEEFKEIDNKKDKENANKKNNKIDKENVKKNLKEEADKKSRKNSRLVESLLQQRKEERILVGFRLEKSVSDTIDKIVKEHKLKKSDFVNDLLKKAMGLN